MGTSEIYRAVLGIDEIVDALVVDVPRPGTEGWMPLFVVLREGAELDDELRKEIARRVRDQCSPRHVPDEVFQIAEVPRTLSGKVLEVPVKRILMGTPAEQAASRDSLANPAALDYFTEMAARLPRLSERRRGAAAFGDPQQRQHREAPAARRRGCRRARRSGKCQASDHHRAADRGDQAGADQRRRPGATRARHDEGEGDRDRGGRGRVAAGEGDRRRAGRRRAAAGSAGGRARP